jgi:hypothetical protein
MIREGKQLRCKHGVHMPITPAQSKPFSAWFDHAGCGGFAPYNRNFDTTLPKLVEKVLARAFRRAHQMEVRTRCGKGNKTEAFILLEESHRRIDDPFKDTKSDVLPTLINTLCFHFC